MSPSNLAGVTPPTTVATLPSSVVSWSPLGSLPASTQFFRDLSKKRWCAVVWTTWSPLGV